MSAKKFEEAAMAKVRNIKAKITGRPEGTVLFPEDAQRFELDMKGIKIPMSFRGLGIHKTRGGWKVKCSRCGDWIAFNKNTIETSGPADKPNLLKQVALGYTVGRDQNKLVADFEKENIDFIEFLRGERRIAYDSARFPIALSGNASITLTCQKCNSKTRINADIGGEFEIRKLPTDVEALIKLGIHKGESVQFFQLRVEKLANKFVEAIRYAQREIEQLKEYKARIEEFCNELKTDSNIVEELLYDTTSAARKSANTKIRQLEEYQKGAVSQVERLMFPMVSG